MVKQLSLFVFIAGVVFQLWAVDETVIASGDQWSYHDQGQDLDTAMESARSGGAILSLQHWKAGILPRLEIGLGHAGPVAGYITDLSGRVLSEFPERVLPAGTHTLALSREGDVTNPGVYVVRMQAGNEVQTRRFVMK